MGVLRALLALSLGSIALVGCGRDGSWTREACSPAKAQPTGIHEVRVDAGRALIYVPSGYDGTSEQPVVFSWHGYGSNAADHLRYADFRPEADRDDFLVVVPDGSDAPPRFNIERGITSPRDDVAFAEALLDRVSSDYCVDTSRVYSVGVSNGAGMSAVLACRSDRFAAVGMDALLLLPDGCPSSPPVPVMGMAGDADLVVPFKGGEINCCGGGFTIPGAADTMRAWAARDGCSSISSPDESDVTDTVERWRWSGCDDDVEVEYWTIHGGGHTWPGASGTSALGPTDQSISASEEFWSFFKRFSREPGGA